MTPERDNNDENDLDDRIDTGRSCENAHRWFPAVDPDTGVGDQDWTGWLAGLTPAHPLESETDAATADLTDEGTAASPDGDASPAVVAGPGSGHSPRPRRGRVVVYGSVAAVGMLALGAVAAGAIAVSRTAPPAATPPMAATAQTPSSQPPMSTAGEAVAPWCPGEQVGGRVSGAGAGDRSSGPGLILAMQYGMYVSRDPDAVRAVFAPAAAVAAEQDTRAAIAAIPAGTRHCVDIVAVDPNRFAVSVTEVHPDRSMQTWDTTVTTGVQPDGRLLVTAIAPGQGAQ